MQSICRLPPEVAFDLSWFAGIFSYLSFASCSWDLFVYSKTKSFPRA
jgi:hypothetical protein